VGVLGSPSGKSGIECAHALEQFIKYQSGRRAATNKILYPRLEIGDNVTVADVK